MLTPRGSFRCTDCVGPTYSPAGECLDCNLPYVVFSGHRTCSPCTAGHGPSEDGTECISCVGAKCPEGVRCEAIADCDACLPGNVSMGDEQCYSCTAQGKAANADQTICISCGVGQAPLDDRTACKQCTGIEFSTFGISCDDCPLGYLPDGGHIICVDVNECETRVIDNITVGVENGGCDALAEAAGESCLNTVGAYRCGECPLGFHNEGSLDVNGRNNGSRCTLPPPPPPTPGRDAEEAGTGAGAQATVEPAVPMTLSIPRNADPQEVVDTLREDLAASLEVNLEEVSVEFTAGGASGRRQMRLADLTMASNRMSLTPEEPGDVTHRRRAQMVDLACIISIQTDTPTGGLEKLSECKIARNVPHRFVHGISILAN